MNREPVAVDLDAETLLRAAHAALAGGEAELARDRAQMALVRAQNNQDRPHQAKALLLLAHLDRLASRFRAAHDSARQAVLLFRALGDDVGESGALSTLAHAATCLGRNEEAIEAALISVHLAEPNAAVSHKAMLFNYLGVAYLWSRDFAKARRALEASIELAEGSGGTVSAFQPVLNELLAELLSAVSVRYDSGSLPQLTEVMARHDRCDALVRRGDAEGFFKGAQIIGLTTWLLSSAMVRTWCGELDAARELLRRVRAHLAALPNATLAHAFEHWVAAELAWAEHDLPDAVVECSAMVEIGERLEYEQMACLGHMLLSQMYETLNEPARAVEALRALRSREELIRAESLAGRERAAQWHLDLRLLEQNMRRLEGTSKHLERLSLEDSLTGLANRRCFEQTIQSVLTARSTHGAPMSVAFIDVDRFKLVNDRHSHHVGDQVLKAIAAILVQATRENDIAARLSGDEFAVLFQRADAPEAARVCERIGAAVAGHAWSPVAAGLAVTVSIGTATARDDDTAESLLHRADAAMYEVKRASVARNAQA